MPPSQKKQKVVPRKVPDRPMVGSRGSEGWKGRWISVEEAKKLSVGAEEWWRCPDKNGNVVEADKSFLNGSPDREHPIWKYSKNGDMYLGNWTEKNGKMLENGFGIMYNSGPAKCEGNVYIGEWKDGSLHGEGVSFWLPSSETWKKNHFAASPVTVVKKGRGKSRGIPFRYEGKYREDQKNDERAVVTLKDGTIRVGPWTNGKPVGDWYSHSVPPTPVTPPRSHEDRPRTQAHRNAPAPRENTLSSRLAEADHPRVPSNEGSPRVKDEPQGRNENDAIDVDGDTEAGANNADTDDDDAAQLEKQRRMDRIQNYITNDVIGHDPDPYIMQMYVRKLYDIGFHSVESLQERLEETHIQSYDWMAELHKEIFLRRLKDGW